MNKEACELLGIQELNTYKFYENEYKKYFEKFVLANIDLKKYDDMITSSDLGFGNVSKPLVLNSKLNEYLKLYHIYILNNFFIEKLNKNEFDILKGFNETSKIDMVSKTYKNIILNDYIDGKFTDKRVLVNYTNSTSLSDMSYNDQLVIALYYGENTISFNDEDSYLVNYNKKKEFLNNIVNNLVNDFNQKLNLSVKVIYEKIV